MKKLMFIGILCLLLPLQLSWARGPQPSEGVEDTLGALIDIVTAPCQILATCLGLDSGRPRCVGPKYKPPKECGDSSTRKTARVPAQEKREARPPKEKRRVEERATPQKQPTREALKPPVAPVPEKAAEAPPTQERVTRPPRVQAPQEAPPVTRAPEPSAGPPRVTTEEKITPKPVPSASPPDLLRTVPQARPEPAEPKEQPKRRTPAREWYWAPCVPMPPPPCF